LITPGSEVAVSDYSDQVRRIKEKLGLARSCDPELKVFGAANHKYLLHSPARVEEVVAFEVKHDLVLPDSYRTFLLEVGNGGVSESGSGAGPYYGIYPIGRGIDDLTYDDVTAGLASPCPLHPLMSDQYWEELRNPAHDPDDDQVSSGVDRWLRGILPIGSQGCTYVHALVMNGPFTGRVVNLDLDGHKAHFAFEDHFLDWYERWLDEVIAGDLQSRPCAWFGHVMGGTEDSLLERLCVTPDAVMKVECLNELLYKQRLSSAVLEALVAIYEQSDTTAKEVLVQILTKFDYQRAKPYLRALAETNLGSVLKAIFWYQRQNCREWWPLIEAAMHRISDDETFRFATYVLREMDLDYGDLIIPFASNDSEAVRLTTYYALGHLPNKERHLEVFMRGLTDQSNAVVRTVLQALKGVTDRRLLHVYRQLAKRYPVDDPNYVRTNLKRRMAEFGLWQRLV